MLHILWLILRTILVILGLLLGIFLLLLLIVLFCPIRYQVRGEKERDISLSGAGASCRVSWLFGILSLAFSYQEKTSSLSFRIFGRPPEFFSGWKKRRKKPGTKKEKKPAGRSASGRPEDSRTEPAELNGKEPPENGSTAVSENNSSAPTEHGTGKASEQSSSASPEHRQEKTAEHRNAQRQGFGRIKARASAFSSALENKKSAFSRNMKKTGWWRDFLTDESTKAAIALGLSRVKGLVKHMLPTEISGHITFDHEDPSVTGGILAVLGATIPIHKNRIIVTPEFQCENALEGEIFLKGRIMLIVFALAAARLFLCRDVRNVIRNWKHKEV